MMLEPVFKVESVTCIEMFRDSLAFEDIDIMICHLLNSKIMG